MLLPYRQSLSLFAVDEGFACFVVVLSRYIRRVISVTPYQQQRAMLPATANSMAHTQTQSAPYSGASHPYPHPYVQLPAPRQTAQQPPQLPSGVSPLQFPVRNVSVAEPQQRTRAQHPSYAEIADAVRLLNLPRFTTHEMMRYRLADNAHINVSEATLQRVLRAHGMTRISQYQPSQIELEQAIRGFMYLNERHVGSIVVWGWLRRYQPSWRISRQRVRQTVHRIDPHAVDIRRDANLRERIYSFGPSHVWHFDQHDKLKVFGFPLHACIDAAIRAFGTSVL